MMDVACVLLFVHVLRDVTGDYFLKASEFFKYSVNNFYCTMFPHVQDLQSMAVSFLHTTPLHTTPHNSTPHNYQQFHSTPLYTTSLHYTQLPTTPLHTTLHNYTPQHTTPYNSTPLHITPHNSTPLHTTRSNSWGCHLHVVSPCQLYYYLVSFFHFNSMTGRRLAWFSLGLCLCHHWFTSPV